ncbi:MAG TPA: alpha/beta hydrolase [Cyclobacteriaceae bacterium]|nr:alpha/beta hydrolase [Cyclobacteriaceae bacterium]
MPEHSGIFYTDHGKGFPVLLIHGFCETHEIWDSFSRELSKNFRILSIDLPGFGKSKLPQELFSIADVGAKVLQWLQELGIKSCIPIGHSLGGYVALEMVHQKPELFKAFGLFHSTAYPDAEERKLSRNKVIEFVSNHGVVPFIESFIPPLFHDSTNPHIQPLVRLASQTHVETLIAYVKAMRDRPDRTNVLQNFDRAILIIAGEKDSGISPDSMIKQASLASKVNLNLLPEVAHMGMFESEGKTLSLVKQFLTQEGKK